MPPIVIPTKELKAVGDLWQQGNNLSQKESAILCGLFDSSVGNALSIMLGGNPIVKPNANHLTASQADCVEVGPVRIVGGVRPQNFDVGYRPDGIRFAFDSKSLNAHDSIKKNWQNMINDLATEATTVHSRFPHAVVAFMVILPTPAVANTQRSAITETLERLSRRIEVNDPLYLAEAISLVLWDPATGQIDSQWPNSDSPIRIERFSERVEAAYVTRYKGLPPHASD